MRDPDQISDLIGHIYDCATQPEHWTAVLARLCADMRLMTGVLGYYDGVSGLPLRRFQHGMAQYWFDRMPEYGFESTEFWGGIARVLGYPVGEITIHSIANPAFDFSSNRFAHEWCRPQGVLDMAATRVTEDDAVVGSLVFSSDRLLETAHDRELDLLRFLSPHIRRSVKISRLLELRSIQNSHLRAALEALPNGVVLLDAWGRILFANSAAETLVRANDGLRATGNVLTLRNEPAAQALSASLRSAAEGRQPPERGSAIAARSSTGAGAVLHVLPLTFGSIRGHLDTRAVAAVFITTELSQVPLGGEAMRLLFDLTPAEIRVCELLVEGFDTAEIAARIGVARSTAKTHLLRIFEKTDTSRQSDLVRLIASLQIARPPAAS